MEVISEVLEIVCKESFKTSTLREGDTNVVIIIYVFTNYEYTNNRGLLLSYCIIIFRCSRKDNRYVLYIVHTSTWVTYML